MLGFSFLFFSLYLFDSLLNSDNCIFSMLNSHFIFLGFRAPISFNEINSTDHQKDSGKQSTSLIKSTPITSQQIEKRKLIWQLMLFARSSTSFGQVRHFYIKLYIVLKKKNMYKYESAITKTTIKRVSNEISADIRKKQRNIFHQRFPCFHEKGEITSTQLQCL